MNKATLVNELTKVLSTQKEAKDALETIFGAMRRALRKGEKVVISGFGSFHIVVRKSRVVRNFKTGESVQFPARQAIKFTPSKELI